MRVRLPVRVSISRYRHDHDAFGRLVLQAPWMVEAMRQRAELVAEAARAASPVDKRPGARHPGRFKESIKVDVVIRPAGGGYRHPRAVGIVSSDAPEAAHLELGTETMRARAPLRTALDVLRR